MFSLTYEFKLKPTSDQESLFENWLEQCRRVYNYALAERKDWYKSRSCQINACSLRSEYIIPVDTPRPTFALQCKSLTEARANIPALKAVQSQVLQQTLKRLEQAFVSMWEQNYGFPRFKKAGQMRSFVFPQLGLSPLQPGAIKLPVIGWVKFRQSRDVPTDAAVKQVRVVKRASGFYAMLTLQWAVDVPQHLPHGEAIAIDVGLLNFIATSNGIKLPRPKFFVNLQRKLKLLQQRVSRKKLGSNNWRKAQLKVARLHEKISNTRKHFHWQVANMLCDEAGMIFVDDLNCKALAPASKTGGNLPERNCCGRNVSQALFGCSMVAVLIHTQTVLLQTWSIFHGGGLEKDKSNLSQLSCGNRLERFVRAYPQM